METVSKSPYNLHNSVYVMSKCSLILLCRSIFSKLKNIILTRTLASVFQVTMLETTSVGMSVVRVNATDADAGQNAAITYSLATDTNNFYINTTSGMLHFFLNIHTCISMISFLSICSEDYI